jgi:hypothetical protein
LTPEMERSAPCIAIAEPARPAQRRHASQVTNCECERITETEADGAFEVLGHDATPVGATRLCGRWSEIARDGSPRSRCDASARKTVAIDVVPVTDCGVKRDQRSAHRRPTHRSQRRPERKAYEIRHSEPARLAASR